MRKKNSSGLFNLIAPIYGQFYHKQKLKFAKVVNNISLELDLTDYSSILDVGCGTGALCAVLFENNMTVTGVDSAEGMLKIAGKYLGNTSVTLIQTSANEPLPFSDKCFDVSIASYVAHGMGQNERKHLYTEMSRVTRYKVIIYDYNQRRRLLTTIIEWLERGDYFRFIRNAEIEMKETYIGTSACFSSVRVVNVDVQAAWYICDPF